MKQEYGAKTLKFLRYVGIAVHYEIILAKTTVTYLTQSNETIAPYVDSSRMKLVKPDIEMQYLRTNFSAARDYILTLVPDEKTLPFYVSESHIRAIVSAARQFIAQADKA